VPACVR